MGNVQGIGSALSFAKTALALDKGQVSGLVKNYQIEYDEEGIPGQGPMTGVYIIQSLGKMEPKTEDDDFTSRFTQMIDRQISNSAFAAWIEEASAAAKIEYNQKVLNPQLAEEEESMTEDTEGASEEEAAAS
jgi:hypothetical protein